MGRQLTVTDSQIFRRWSGSLLAKQMGQLSGAVFLGVAWGLACLLSSSPTKMLRELFGSPSGEMALQLPRDPVQGPVGSESEMALELSSVSYTGQPG